MARLGEETRQQAFFLELECTEDAAGTLRELQEIKQNSNQIRKNLIDLEMKRKCLMFGLAKWNKLSEKARKHKQGAEVLAKKYPDRRTCIRLQNEASKLKSFYRKVNARLLHERADIESQILLNEAQIRKEKLEKESCSSEHEKQKKRYNVLYNKIEESKELQRHCLFATRLWQPTPA